MSVGPGCRLSDRPLCSRRIFAQILHCDPVLGSRIKEIQNDHEEIFQRLHQKINQIRRPAASYMSGNGIAAAVIKTPKPSVHVRQPFRQKILKCIGYQKLPVDHNPVSVPFSHPKRFYHLPVSACRHRTQIMFIVLYVGRRFLKRQRPVAGLRPCLDQAVRLLSEQNQDHGQ